MKKDGLMGMVAALLFAACLPAQAIVLRYQPKVGVVYKHKATMAGRMESSAEGMGQSMRVEMTVSVDYSEKALSKTEEATRLETRLLGGTATVRMGEDSQTTDVPTGRMVADVDRRGRLVNLVEAEFGEDLTQELMGMGAGTSSNWAQFAAFPEGDVKVDDSWTDTATIPAALGSPELTLTFTSRLLALTTFQDRKCAKLRTSFQGPVKFEVPQIGLPAEEEAEAAMEATLQGDILWYYDYENSVYVYGEGSVGMDMKMPVPMPDTPGGTMTTKLLMNVKTAMAEP